MELGWIKLHRKLNSNDLLVYDNNAFCMFVRLLTVVDRKTGSYRTGRYKLATMNNMSPSTAYRTLKRLEKEKIISLKVNSKWTTIYICKWSEYQSEVNSKWTASGQQVDTKQEGRSKNKKKNKGEFFQNKELQEAFIEFEEMRNKIKKPMTDRAKNLIVGKLEKMYPKQINMQIKCLNQSIENCWQNIYTVKVDPNIGQLQHKQPPNRPDITDNEREKAKEKLDEIKAGFFKDRDVK